MSKRVQAITLESIDSLYLHHPYLLLLQKQDWQEYLILIAEIYDLLEEENAIVPYESLRSILLQHYSAQDRLTPEQKVNAFVSMALSELRVIKDRFDHLGQRYIETTREGKELLKLFEQLLSQKVRFTGLTADTLLIALNTLLMQQNTITQEEAVEHHKEKIRAYQEDLKRIQKYGIHRAELLPVDYSRDELLQQAEEAALHILTAVEDVKLAIEKVRHQLAQSYFKQTSSAGANINLVVDFYNSLEQTPEYRSYNLAFDLLSQIEGIGGRFRFRDVDEIIGMAIKQDILQRAQIEKSHLGGFKGRFYRDHQSIQEKKKSQLQLLQQQVLYAMSSQTKVVEKELRDILSACYQHKEDALDYLSGEPLEVRIPTDFSFGEILLSSFEVPLEIPQESLSLNELSQEEAQSLARALLEAEEATIQKTLERLRRYLQQNKEVRLSEYSLEWGLTEFYVLSEIEFFCEDIERKSAGIKSFLVGTRYGEFYLKDVLDGVLRFKGDYQDVK